MIEAMSELPAHLRRTITWDRGSEMANWRDIDPPAEGTDLLL